MESGDTAISLAKRFSLPVCKLIKLNNLKGEVQQGDMLYIESTDKELYLVKPFETAESIGKKFNISPQKILSDNGVPYVFYGLIITL